MITRPAPTPAPIIPPVHVLEAQVEALEVELKATKRLLRISRLTTRAEEARQRRLALREQQEAAHGS